MALTYWRQILIILLGQRSSPCNFFSKWYFHVWRSISFVWRKNYTGTKYDYSQLFFFHFRFPLSYTKHLYSKTSNKSWTRSPYFMILSPKIQSGSQNYYWQKNNYCIFFLTTMYTVYAVCPYSTRATNILPTSSALWLHCFDVNFS